MIELYGAVTGNCLRAAIALEEAGLDYTARPLDLRAGEHRSEAILRLNPAGKVPILVEATPDAGAPFVMSQSNAIALYAAERAPGRLLPPSPGAARARALERWFYIVTDVIAVSHAGFQLNRLGDAGAAASMQARAIEAASAVERFLDDGPYMASDRFTLADIAAYTIIASFGEAEEIARRPRVAAWRERVAARPAVTRGMHAFD